MNSNTLLSGNLLVALALGGACTPGLDSTEQIQLHPQCDGSPLVDGPLEAQLRCRQDPIAQAIRELAPSGRAVAPAAGVEGAAFEREGLAAAAGSPIQTVALPLGPMAPLPDGVGGFAQLVSETAARLCPEESVDKRWNTFIISDDLVGTSEVPELFWCDGAQSSLCEECDQPGGLCETEFFLCEDDSLGVICKPCDGSPSLECATEVLPFPRVIAAVCPSSATKMGQAFFALSFEDGAGDVDAQAVEAFAWDASTGRYEFYRSVALPDGAGGIDPNGLLVITNPLELPEGSPIDRCDFCHRGNTDQSGLNRESMPNVPIMNELVEPWSHWNARTFGPSQKFEIPESFVSSMPKFKSLTYGINWSDADPDQYRTKSWLLRSADMFESIVRQGFKLAARTRIAAVNNSSGSTPREQLAATREAHQLLHPLFCEEHINFVSEQASSDPAETPGLFNSYGPVLDVALAGLVPSTLREFVWVSSNPPMFNIGLDPQSDLGVIELVAMRGQSSIAFEEELVRTGALDRDTVLQIRMLDWQTPVLSYFRCGLWDEMDAAIAFEEARADMGEQPDPIVGGATVRERMVNLLGEIMKVRHDAASGGERVSLLPTESAMYLSVNMPQEEAAQEALSLQLGNALACEQGRRTDCAGLEIADIVCQKGQPCDLSACEVGYCRLNAWAFGEHVKQYLADLSSAEGRRRVRALRDRRLCMITGESRVDVSLQGWNGFPGVPAMPEDFDPALDCR